MGLAAGALAGAGYVASRKFSSIKDDESVPGTQSRDGLKANRYKPDPGSITDLREQGSDDKGPHDSPKDSI